jgi:DNA modification methylase
VITILQGDVLDKLKELPDKSVHCVITSPPYWGLRDYGTANWEGGDSKCNHNPQKPDGGERADRSLPLGRGGLFKETCGKCGAVRIDQQIGLEKTPEEYVEKMVVVFREVKRVLRDDGTVWLNMGDCYNSGSGGYDDKYNGGFVGREDIKNKVLKSNKIDKTLKPKDLVGMPWRLAFALQADGWYLRSDIIWSKPNPMPESVTDRPTKSHEYIFLLTKKAQYFYDAGAIREAQDPSSLKRLERGWNGDGFRDYPGGGPQNHFKKYMGKTKEEIASLPGRNRRTVWEITTQPFPEAHFATFPEKLVEPCIKAGTSERGCCPVCGAPWERMIETTRYARNELPKDHPNYRPNQYTGKNVNFGEMRNDAGWTDRMEKGWQPTCKCGREDTIPCVVLDPFMGSGTTLKVARDLKRDGIGIELSAEYIKIAEKRLRLNEQLEI